MVKKVKKSLSRAAKKSLFPIQDKVEYSSREASLIIDRDVAYMRFLGREGIIPFERKGNVHFYKGNALFKWMREGRTATIKGVDVTGRNLELG
jgi:hypothetical protein